VCGAVVAVAAAAATVAFLIGIIVIIIVVVIAIGGWQMPFMVVGIGGKVDDDAAVGLVLGDDDCDVFVFVVFDDDLVWECWDI
jgi:hypothetical protein